MGAALPVIEASPRERAFRADQVVLDGPPSRWQIDLTERCNLACAHCITEAPARTREGRARSLSTPVLEALRPHLGAVEYLGLSHAGEPALAPLLEPLLLALEAARSGRPSVVHLLSNGLALEPRRLERLVELGVCSLSISVDGLSAASHDRLRVGSRIDALLERLRVAATWRREAAPGLRLGLAWTLTSANLAEVPDLVRLAAELGLDWLKLEELAPVNDVARALQPEPEPAEAVVRAAERLGDALGLVVLDHVAPVRTLKCRLEDPRAARVARADDHVNRCELNPCRQPWDTIFVEPDGAVKPIDFHHPPAGSLLDHDLMSIWNGPAFVLARSRAMRSRPCGLGPKTCPIDGGPATW